MLEKRLTHLLAYLLSGTIFISANSFAEGCLQYPALYDDFNSSDALDLKWSTAGSNFAQKQEGQVYLAVIPKSKQEIGGDVHGVDLIPTAIQSPQLIQANLILEESSIVSSPANGIGVRLDGIFFNDGISDIKASIGVDKKQFPEGEKEVIAVHLFRAAQEGVIAEDIIPWQVIREHDGKSHVLQMFWDGKILQFTIDEQKVFEYKPTIKLLPKNPTVKITAFAFPMSSVSAFVDNVFFGDAAAAKQTSECYAKNVVDTVKTKPQILMAGFDPAFIDKTDSTFKVVTVVEEGANPINNVYLKLTPMIGQTNLYFSMHPKGKILVDRQTSRYGTVYESELFFDPATLPLGSASQVAQHHFFSLFGYQPFQFSIVAQDRFENIIMYPYFSFDEYIGIPKDTTMPSIMDYSQGTIKSRDMPQVIMAGFTPLVGFDENTIQFMAVVRQGSSPITNVSLRDLKTGNIIQNLLLKDELPNGDKLYGLTMGIDVAKHEEGTPYAGSLHNVELWDIWNEMISIEAQDQNGNVHRFSEIQIGHYLTKNE